jgi:hypothetical protein
LRTIAPFDDPLAAETVIVGRKPLMTPKSVGVFLVCDPFHWYWPVSLERIVGHNPEPFASMPSADSSSRNNKRDCFVACIFQRGVHIVDCQAVLFVKKPKRVLENRVARPYSEYNLKSSCPEKAVIFRAEALPAATDGLARNPGSGNVEGAEGVRVECFDVVIDK